MTHRVVERNGGKGACATQFCDKGDVLVNESWALVRNLVNQSWALVRNIRRFSVLENESWALVRNLVNECWAFVRNLPRLSVSFR